MIIVFLSLYTCIMYILHTCLYFINIIQADAHVGVIVYIFLLCLCIVHIIHLSMYNLLAAPQEAEPLFGIRIVLREIIVTKLKTARHPCIVRNAFSHILGQGGVNTLRNYVHMYTPSLTGLLSHIWSELGSLCWIRPSYGDGTTKSNQIFHLLHIYACWKGEVFSRINTGSFV